MLDGTRLLPELWHGALPPDLLESPPEGMKVVVLSRARPKLAWERWRLAGGLREFGPEQLRLDREQTGHVLSATGITSLPVHAADTIHEISRGWISGVLLCSLHVRSSIEPERALETLGENVHLHEFLQQEVLNELDPLRQRCLLDLSILSTATNDLCEAVLERVDASQMMQTLADRTSLFERTRNGFWTMHPLAKAGFSAMLRLREPDRHRALHRRAARWNLARSRAEEAVCHGLEARDPDVLESVAERAIQNLFRNSDFLALQRHVRDLPPGLAHDRPFLSLFLAWALFHSGREKEGVPHLDRARRLALQARTERSSRERQRTILIHAAFLRSMLLRLEGRSERAQGMASSAFASSANRKPFLAASIRVQSAVGHFLSGSLDSAREALEDSMRRAEAAEHHLAYYGAGYTLAEILVLRGSVREAHGLLAGQQRYADEGPARGGPVSGYMQIARSRLHLLQGNIADACEAAEKGILLGRRCDNIRILNYGLAARAEIAALSGDLDGASRALDEAVAVARRTRMHWAIDYDDLEAKRMRLLIPRLGPTALNAWLARTLPALGSPHLPSWDPFRTSMRLLTCLGRAREAVDLGRPWTSYFHAQGLDIPLQDASYATALACEFLGLHDEAFGHIDVALDIAGRLGAVGPFLHGRELDGIRRDVLCAWQRRSAGATPAAIAVASQLGAPGSAAPPEAKGGARGVSNLSEREVEVLKSIRNGLSNREIADMLFVAESTVKTHIKNIFVKLGVANRTHAVSLARDSGIL